MHVASSDSACIRLAYRIPVTRFLYCSNVLQVDGAHFGRTVQHGQHGSEMVSGGANTNGVM